MSECVVRMEKPKSCDDCDIAIKYQRFGTEIQCPFLGWYADYDNCPVLLQLPEGHGRLGDLDELLNLMFHYDDYYGAKEAHDVDLIHRDSICYAIENAPTIVPATEGGKA